MPAVPVSANKSTTSISIAKTTGVASTTAPGSISPIIGSPTRNPTNGQVEVKINPKLPDSDKMQMILDAQNGRQIDYYGKVVDQYGVPVAGAKIRGVIVTSSFAGSSNQNYFTETDGNGQFKFNNLHGPNFGVVPSKDGYEYNERQTTNWSDDYKPDPAKPMIMTMYKLQGAEPMVHVNRLNSRVPYDGTSATFDLFTGKQSDAGDLKITLLRNPLQIKRGKDHFEWNVKIEIEGGGLVESRDAYTYMAPENGYQPAFEFSQAKDAPNWTPELAGVFYVHTSKGTYGLIKVDVFSDSDRPDVGTGIILEAWVNPTPGSRNLEFDPAQQVRPQ